ncbi:MAG: hypothetical protein IKS96_07105 [Fibrobacter sp.]|nr:hypothetical protein [Fibrobacter sp.]MBR6449695.1 hypothetical protein [Fibrobacter sp.]
MTVKNLQKRQRNVVATMAYVYAILLKVADRSMSAEQAIDLIRSFITL